MGRLRFIRRVRFNGAAGFTPLKEVLNDVREGLLKVSMEQRVLPR